MTDRDKAQSQGRTDNAAEPKAPGTSEVSPQAYPATRPDDSIERTGRSEGVGGERRSFDKVTGNPAPRQGAGDGSPTAANDGRLGPQGDPAEGKR
ncbi:MAG: hypothetical protein ACHP9T_14275 [Caulobacterales bacterium]